MKTKHSPASDILNSPCTHIAKRGVRFALALAGFSLVTGHAEAALTAFWGFEGNLTESVSTTAGTANGAAVANGSPIAPTGANSLSLPSSGSWVDTNTNGGLGGIGSFTVFAFINTTTTVNAAFFNYSPTIGATPGADLRMFVYPSGNLRIEMNGGSGFDVLAPGDLDDGATHAVAAVFDSSTGNSFLDVDIYIDGALYNVTSGTDNLINLGAGEVFIGRDQVNDTNRPFVGLIDDVRIYNNALSLSELNALTIPEPASALLGGLGLLTLLRRRR